MFNFGNKGKKGKIFKGEKERLFYKSKQYKFLMHEA